MTFWPQLALLHPKMRFAKIALGHPLGRCSSYLIRADVQFAGGFSAEKSAK